MTLDVDELDILDIQVGQKAEITADAISDRTFEGVVTSISSAGTTSGGTTTYPVTIRIDDTGSLMPGMNATAALDIPPCRRYVVVKATAGFAVRVKGVNQRICLLQPGDGRKVPDHG